MPAIPQVTRLVGTLTNVAQPRLTRLAGAVAGTVGVKVTSLTGTVAKAALVQVTSLSGQVSKAAGAPSVTPSGPQDVVSAALVTLTASGVPTPPATISSYTWRLVSRDLGAKTPQFLATTGVSIQLYVPPDSVARHYTIGVVAKDSSNRVSEEGLFVLTVEAADYLIPTVGGWNLPGQDSFAVGGAWA